MSKNKLTEKQAKEAWNNFADKYNQWDALDKNEKDRLRNRKTRS